MPVADDVHVALVVHSGLARCDPAPHEVCCTLVVASLLAELLDLLLEILDMVVLLPDLGLVVTVLDLAELLVLILLLHLGLSPPPLAAGLQKMCTDALGC